MKLWNRFWIKPEELPIDEWCQRGPRRNADFMLQGQRDKQWAQSAQLRVSYLFAHGPRACAGLSSSLNVDLNQRGCQLCPHKKKENKSLFKISRELQFGLCKLGKPHSSPPPGMAREEGFYGEGKEAAGNRTHCFPSTGSSSGKVGLWLHFLLGSAMSQDARAPCSGLRTPFRWGFCLLAFWNRHRGL